jgi:ubiquinone/menaquinone biosynthesis C-methylase UbiE
MRMGRFEKLFVNSAHNSRKVAERAATRLAVAGAQPGQTCLDVGCGNGTAARYVADTLRLRVTGVDVDPEQIASARSATGSRNDVRFLTASATQLPFDDGEFNFVFSSLATHHMPDWSAALGEMVRVLELGGRLVYTDLTLPNWLKPFVRGLGGRFAGAFSRQDLDRRFTSLGVMPVEEPLKPGRYDRIFVKGAARSRI